MSLRKRVVRASLWTIGGQITSQLLRLVSNLIMTRLLFPDLFGVMAVVTVVMNGVLSLSEIGVAQSIIQSKRGREADFLNTAWTIQILRGWIVAVFIVSISAAIYYANELRLFPNGSVFAHPELPPVLASTSIGVILNGFRSTHLQALFRTLATSKFIVLEVFSQIVGIASMIAWATFDRSIWALAIGGIVTELVKTALSHFVITGERNHFAWDRDSVFEIYGFGKWLFIATIFSYFGQQGDKLVLGWLISPESMGFYTIAFLLATAYQLLAAGLVGRVFFPAFCEVGNQDPHRLRGVYYRSRTVIDFGSFVVAGLLCSYGDLLVGVLYDQRYAEAGWMLQVLAVGLLSVGFRSADQLLLALGRTKMISALAVLQGAGPLILIPTAFYFFGLNGVLWAASFSFFPNMLLSFFFLHRVGVLNLVLEFRMLPVFFIVLLVGMASRSLLGV